MARNKGSTSSLRTLKPRKSSLTIVRNYAPSEPHQVQAISLLLGALLLFPSVEMVELAA